MKNLIIVLVLVVVCSFVLCACSDDSKKDTPAPNKTPNEQQNTPPKDDGAFEEGEMEDDFEIITPSSCIRYNSYLNNFYYNANTVSNL